jgi:hypothetical protein
MNSGSIIMLASKLKKILNELNDDRVHVIFKTWFCRSKFTLKGDLDKENHDIQSCLVILGFESKILTIKETKK